MIGFWSAIRFLTVLPLPAGWGEDSEGLSRSVPFFPLVGIWIGVLSAGWTWGTGHLFPGLLTGVLAVTFLLALSGGLHMDGLSDAADGFFSARPRKEMLEIMRDSHIGAMGVMAIVAVFGLKVGALAGLSPEVRWRTVLLMPVAGRCALVISMAILPYARAEGGLGTLFFQRRPRFAAVWALLVLGGMGWAVGEMCGLIAAAASVAVTLGAGLYTHRKIGGATGDTLGATCEAVECVPALTFVAWSGLNS